MVIFDSANIRTFTHMQLRPLHFLLLVVFGILTLACAFNPQWFIAPIMHVPCCVPLGLATVVCLVRSFERM